MAKAKSKIKEDDDKKLKCPSCGAEKLIDRGFYKSDSIKYKSYDNRCFICKTCLKNKCFSKKGLFDKDSFKVVLKDDLDKPFYEKLYQQALQDEKDTLGKYLSLLNLSKKNNVFWKDGETEERELQIKNKNTIEMNIESNFEVTPEMIKIWGRGYEPEDYEFLEDSYLEWSTRYKCDTLAEEKTYRFLSLKELEIRKSRENGNGSVDKLEETFRKLMSDANVTPRDANSANDPENMNALGLWIRDIEKYRPAEYFEDKKIYFDFDSLVEYMQRFIFRPLKNLLVGTRDFDKEFNVEGADQIDNIEDEDGDENGITQ